MGTVAEPEPTTTDTQGDAEFNAEPEPIAPEEEEPVVVEEPRKPTKKELKAVEKFNAAVDNIAKILSQRLSERDALPLPVDADVLEELDREVTTLPPTTTSTTTVAPPECPEKWVDKCLAEKCQGKQKCLDKCKAKGCATEKKRKGNKNKNKNKNKNIKRKDDNKNKKNVKKNNKKNRNNRTKNRSKNIRNRLFGNRRGSNRQSKHLPLEEFEDELVAEGRRRGDDNSAKRNRRKNKNRNSVRSED